MNYAWVIDQTKCIGCHACSTACKSENDVPLGVHRTWVKNVEVGGFPNVRRHFAVLRCNHCADPPCVHICPVSAMYQRADGIVDIAHDRCIGCKACMQACPYDAIHMDPSDDTAAKCHFCAHRVDRGLLPACVVVCPVEALVFGDLDDANSRVSRIVGSTPVTVRRPEQGTRPKAFYVGAHQATLDPLAAVHENAYMWSERRPGTAKDNSHAFSVWRFLEGNGHHAETTAREMGGTSRSSRPPRDRMPKARVAYDVHHEITWKGKVSAYLWTKSIAAGAAFVAAVGLIFGSGDAGQLFGTAAPVIALVFLAATGALLVADLKRPERFLFVLLRPQWRSWLAKGAYIITVFGGLLTLWLAFAILGWPVPAYFLGATALAGAATAVYTAFLFGQCEARDLWQTPLLGVALLLQMLVAGAGALAIASMVWDTPPNAFVLLRWIMVGSLVGHVAAVFLGEVVARHGSSNAAAAAHVMTHGTYAPLFWTGVSIGAVVPVVLLMASGSPGVIIGSAVLSLAGLLAYEHAFVMSGQSVPIS